MTWMRSNFLVLVMMGWVAACGGNTPPPTDGPKDPTPQEPEVPQVIAGSLKIHTRLEGATSVYVMLGDGTRFFKKLDASGDVTFEDPSLVGPQDLTLVAHDESGSAHASTYLALERPEIWLPGAWTSPLTPTPQSAYITGKVKGMGDSSKVYVSAVGLGLWEGSTPVNADGSYRLQVKGTLPAVVDLFVYEDDPIYFFKRKAVGLKRGISLSAGQEVTGQEITLDHPIDQQTQLTFQGAEVYQQDLASVTLQFFLDGEHFFETSEKGFDSPTPWRLPASVPSFTPTAPFDTIDARLLVDVGSPSDPSGRVHAVVPVENLSSVTLSLPKPLTLTAPAALGTRREPTIVNVGSALVFQWSTDAAAQMTEFSMAPEYPNYETLSWTVTAPGSVTSFKPFRLRLDETSFAGPFFHGHYRISLYSHFDADQGTYADFFTQTPAEEPLTPLWQTWREGSLDLR